MKRIHCNGGFKSIIDEIADNFDISMNYANPDDHIPYIERNKRVVQERFRIDYYRLSYNIIKMLMIRHLLMISTTKLNIFAAKGGISAYCYPHMILNQINWDYKKKFSMNLFLMFRQVRWKIQQIWIWNLLWTLFIYVRLLVFKG